MADPTNPSNLGQAGQQQGAQLGAGGAPSDQPVDMANGDAPDIPDFMNMGNEARRSGSGNDQPDLSLDPNLLARMVEEQETNAQKIIRRYGPYLKLAAVVGGFLVLIIIVWLYGIFGSIDKIKPPEIVIQSSRITVERNTNDTDNNQVNSAATNLENDMAAQGGDQNALDTLRQATRPDSPAFGSDTGISAASLMEDLPLENIPLAPDRFAGLMPPAPNIELIDSTLIGPLPVTSGNISSFQYYARPVSLNQGRVPVALMVMDMGISPNMLERAMFLPADITLVFAPYSNEIQRNVNLVRSKGYEVALYLPIQPEDYPRSDAGPNALSLELETDENLERLHWNLSRFSGYSTVVIKDIGLFINGAVPLQPVISQIAQRGLGLMVSDLDGAEVINYAKAMGYMSSIGDVQLLNPMSRTSFMQELSNAEVLAQTNGSLVIAVGAWPNNVQRIREWASTLSAKNIQLVPLSTLLKFRNQ